MRRAGADLFSDLPEGLTSSCAEVAGGQAALSAVGARAVTASRSQRTSLGVQVKAADSHATATSAPRASDVRGATGTVENFYRSKC